jgi:hypothetical protein
MMDDEGWTLTPCLRWTRDGLQQMWVKPKPDPLWDMQELQEDWRPVPVEDGASGL